MNYLFITCGPTHSGKTTFGEKLRGLLPPNTILIDNDRIDAFIQQEFNNLRTDDTILKTRTPSNPDLRLRIPQLITDYALTENYNVIVTAGHPKKIIRDAYYEIAKKHHTRVILLLFRIHEDELARRIERSNRSTDILHSSVSFKELLNKQKGLFEEPTNDERTTCYRVYEIYEDNTEAILKNLATLP